MTGINALSEKWTKALENPSCEVLTLQIIALNPNDFEFLKGRVLECLSAPRSHVRYDFLGAAGNVRGYPVMAFEVPEGTGIEKMVGDVDTIFEQAGCGYTIYNKASGMHL